MYCVLSLNCWLDDCKYYDCYQSWTHWGYCVSCSWCNMILLVQINRATLGALKEGNLMFHTWYGFWCVGGTVVCADPEACRKNCHRLLGFPCFPEPLQGISFPWSSSACLWATSCGVLLSELLARRMKPSQEYIVFLHAKIELQDEFDLEGNGG